jgi:predicted dehydrogenase
VTQAPDRPRIGVIGTGWWAVEHHLPSLAAYPGARLTAIAEPNGAKAEAVADRFGVRWVFETADELIGSGLVDGVVVATPHASHYPIARAALDAGLHVLVEKPMALTAADAWDLVARADACRRHLMVGYTVQFTPAAARLKQAIETGELGSLHCVSGVFASVVERFLAGSPDDYADAFGYSMWGPDPATYGDPANAGGGQATTQLTHLIGLIFAVTGLAVRRLTAFMYDGGRPVDLADAVSFDCVGGAVGTVAANGTLTPGQPIQQFCNFFGDRGSARIELDSGRLGIWRRDGSEEHVVPDGGEAGYPAARPVRVFAELIAGRAANPAPARPAARAVEFVEASYRSAASGRPVCIRSSG